MFGELVPVGGGDPIPLFKNQLLIGRRESCDIVLRFSNVSAHHCELTLVGGYWYVRDTNSRNGVKINNVKLIQDQHRLDPGDLLAISKHNYTVEYVPLECGAVGPPADDNIAEVMAKSLLERAGLANRKLPNEVVRRYNQGG